MPRDLLSGSLTAVVIAGLMRAAAVAAAEVPLAPTPCGHVAPPRLVIAYDGAVAAEAATWPELKAAWR